MDIKGNIKLGSSISETSYQTDTGTANAYVVSPRIAVTAYTAGLQISFKAGNANTGASTLNVSGLGTKSIVKNVSTALAAGDILANQIVTVVYDGTNFQIGSGSAGTSGTSGASGSSGSSGISGSSGSSGVSGSSGSSGVSGSSGSSGANGSSGVSGSSGSSGVSGSSGSSGVSGSSGSSGASGSSGSSGVSGSSGSSGVSGSSGSSGASGSSGSSGVSGSSGSSGASGSSGSSGLSASSISSYNVTPVTVSANSTGDQSLQSYVVTGGNLNVVGDTLNVRATGIFTINTTATFTLKVKLGALTLATFTTASITATVTNAPWFIDYEITTATNGATGTLEHGGWAGIKLTAAAGLGGIYLTPNTAVSSAIDLTANQTLLITATFSANGNGASANAATSRKLSVQIS